MLKYICMENVKINKNVLVMGICYEFVQSFCADFANFSNLYYLDVESLIEYSVMDRIKMKDICGAEYVEEQEKKVVLTVADYENSAISMKFSTMLNNLKFIKTLDCVKVYVCLSKGQISQYEKGKELNVGLNEIVFEERNKFLKKNCDILFKCDINNIERSFNDLQNQILLHLSEETSEN